MEIPITETSNQITTTIDIASSHGMCITTELSRYIVSSTVITTIDIASSHGMCITTELSRYIVSSKVITTT